MQVNLLVGRQVASFFEGSIQYLNLADRLYQLPLGVVAIAIGVVLGIVPGVISDTIDETASGWIDISDPLRQTNLAVYEGDNVSFYIGLINRETDEPIYSWTRTLGKSWYVDHEVEIELDGIDQGEAKDTASWGQFYADFLQQEKERLEKN